MEGADGPTQTQKNTHDVSNIKHDLTNVRRWIISDDADIRTLQWRSNISWVINIFVVLFLIIYIASQPSLSWGIPFAIIFGCSVVAYATTYTSMMSKDYSNLYQLDSQSKFYPY